MGGSGMAASSSHFRIERVGQNVIGGVGEDM